MARVNTRFTPFTTNPVIGTAQYPDDIDVRNSEMEPRMEEIDSIGQEMNDVADEVNLLREQSLEYKNTSQAQAELATRKANEASASATNALNSKNSTQILFNQTEDLIESLVIPIEATYNYKTIDSNFVSEFESFIDFKIGE